MKSKCKNFIVLIATIVCLPFVMYFFILSCGREILTLIARSDVIYFNWRSMPILSMMPFILYFEITIASCLFTRDRKAHPFLSKYMTHISGFSCILFFLTALLQPAITIGFSFSSYHACPADGIFSGVYYVKDKRQCEKLTSAVAWE
ncbi:DUF1240 domain-containing protein [Buttiauxella gaviniae]|uniref:DUF1240 domain-containing protein n=1 Tax=Buttiauxella gaviniae TaxID=82990 RepID=A0ABV3NP97_9ENTR